MCLKNRATVFYDISVCHSCIKLVSTSHLVSHYQKCSATSSIAVSDIPSSMSSADLPSLDEVCSLRCPTIQFVPNKPQPAFALVFSAALKAVIFENSVSACSCCLFFPVLNVVGITTRLFPSNRYVQWGDGKLSDLWHKAVSHSSYPIRPSVPKGDTV